MAHSTIHIPKHIPRVYLQDIQSIERRCLGVNAICLITIGISCLRNTDLIRGAHELHPEIPLISFCRASCIYDVICDMLFIILPLHLIAWKLRMYKFITSLHTVREDLAYPFKIYAHEMMYDGNPLRFSIYASLFYACMQEIYAFLLPENIFLSHIVTFQAAIAITIFMTGIAFISNKQTKHLHELDQALKSDTLNT